MLARRAFPDTPVYLGGIEASLRRFAHYDYWADRVMPSILESTGADGVMYGMSEHSVVELANNLRHGRKGADACVGVRGTAYMAHDAEGLAWDAVECPSYEDVCVSKPDYARSVKLQYDEQDAVRGRALLQRHGRRVLIQNPPAKPLTTEEMDHVYALPYMRTSTTRPTRHSAVFRPFRRFSFLSFTTEAASVRAISAHLRSIRDATFRCAATRASSRKRKNHPDARLQRAISMMSAVRAANFRFPACKKQGHARLLQGQALPVPICVQQH